MPVSLAIRTALCILVLGGMLAVPVDSTASPLDCPLRDEPFSLQTPLMDIMLSPAATAAVNRHMPGVLERLPSSFASTQAPSFSAILTLREMAGMSGQLDALPAVAADLAQLSVTDADRSARCARYDSEVPEISLPADTGNPRLLVFEKMTGFRDGPSVDAASATLRTLAGENGWDLAFTDKGGAMTPAFLARFDAVIWNNVSGDVLTLSQRKAFEDYIHNGGGYVGIHGSAGDFVYYWDWYVDELIGARFIGHPMDPQYQDARIVVADNGSGIGRGLPTSWTLNEEWYSFRSSPRLTGANVIATLDESSYSPVGRGGQDLRMGDHPIVWTRCVGKGRSFYSAIGHRPEAYADLNHRQLLAQGIIWAVGNVETACHNNADSKR